MFICKCYFLNSNIYLQVPFPYFRIFVLVRFFSYIYMYIIYKNIYMYIFNIYIYIKKSKHNNPMIYLKKMSVDI